MSTPHKPQTCSVFVAIVGRPNVGKSSLTNRLVGEKVAIVTNKPQTTRTRITGVLTKGPVQFVFLDTPGLQKPRNRLGERMAKAAKDTAAEGDVVLMLFEPLAPLTEVEHEQIAEIKAGGVPALAAVNKADAIANREEITPRVEEVRASGAFDTTLLVSAATGENCDELLDLFAQYAVDGPHFFSADSYTDQPEKQLVAETIREKILLYMDQEIPHGTAVEVERFKERADKPIIDIDVNIYCERKSHKGMIIGKGGSMLKKIASAARSDIEELLDARVNLQCWVKVKNDWRDNDFLLNNFGFAK